MAMSLSVSQGINFWQAAGPLPGILDPETELCSYCIDEGSQGRENFCQAAQPVAVSSHKHTACVSTRLDACFILFSVADL